MASSISPQPKMVINEIEFNPIRDTPQERAGLDALVLDWDQRKMQGLRWTDFSTKELEASRRCEFCRKRLTSSKRTKFVWYQDGERYEVDEAEAKSMKDENHRITQEMAFSIQMVEDLEWALLVRQRLVFMAETTAKETNNLKEENSAEPSNSVANYYLCPFYVVPDPECFFDYSEFTITDEPIWHKPGPDGITRHLQSQMNLSTVTGNVSWYDAELTEEDFQEYLRIHGQLPLEVLQTGPCNRHLQPLMKGKYACCDKGIFTPGCAKAPQHTNRQNLAKLYKEFRLHETPQDSKNPRQCIALDCEMGIAENGESELIRVSAVDYFSGETILDSLVFPTVNLLHPNTKYSGVTWQMLHSARRTKQAFLGRDAARRRLWTFVGPETIVIVHGGQGDFLALRWIHRRAIDTQACEGRRLTPIGAASLKNLTRIHLGREIQPISRKGHDSLEDAQATRDLAHFYTQNVDPPVEKIDTSNLWVEGEVVE